MAPIRIASTFSKAACSPFRLEVPQVRRRLVLGDRHQEAVNANPVGFAVDDDVVLSSQLYSEYSVFFMRRYFRVTVHGLLNASSIVVISLTMTSGLLLSSE